MAIFVLTTKAEVKERVPDNTHPHPPWRASRHQPPGLFRLLLERRADIGFNRFFQGSRHVSARTGFNGYVQIDAHRFPSICAPARVTPKHAIFHGPLPAPIRKYALAVHQSLGNDRQGAPYGSVQTECLRTSWGWWLS